MMIHKPFEGKNFPDVSIPQEYITQEGKKQSHNRNQPYE